MSKKKKSTRRRTGSRQNKTFLLGAVAGAVLTYVLTSGSRGGGGTILIPDLPTGPGTGLPTDSGVGLIRRRLLPLSLDAPLPAKYIV
jgi:hypothetical protein